MLKIRFFCKDIRETLKKRRRVLRVKIMTKFKTNTHLSLSLLVELSMYFDFPERMSLFLSLFTFAKTVWIMEFRKECFVNLKICACDRKCTKCRSKADAHDKIGFQYISISVYIVRSHARIQGGGGGGRWSGSPLKNHNLAILDRIP